MYIFVSALWIDDLAWVDGVETTDEFTGDVAGEPIYHGYQKKRMIRYMCVNQLKISSQESESMNTQIDIRYARPEISSTFLLIESEVFG
jgi:hypothetical protein